MPHTKQHETTMNNSDKKLYLLDAYALIYRSYYAFINNPRITTTGINTSATFGFCNFLLELLELEHPTHLAVVFDPDGPTFRHEMYPLYKAQRPPLPEELRTPRTYLKRILAGLGIRLVDVPGFEADDVIGTMSLLESGEVIEGWPDWSDAESKARDLGLIR